MNCHVADSLEDISPFPRRLTRFRRSLTRTGVGMRSCPGHTVTHTESDADDSALEQLVSIQEFAPTEVYRVADRGHQTSPQDNREPLAVADFIINHPKNQAQVK